MSYLLLWLGFAAWVFFDARNRQMTKSVLWSIGTLFAGVITLPLYFAKRNLFAGEVREGGAGWNAAKVFALYWTITMFVAGVASMGVASRAVATASSSASQAGAAIGSMLGLGLLFGIWFAVLVGALVIGLFLKKSSIVETGPTGELAGQNVTPKKLGAWMLAVWLVVACVGVLVSGMMKGSDGSSALAATNQDKLAELAAMPAAPLSPTGELAATFNMMSDSTDLQRENTLKEITGKVVEWTLPVYEVRRDGNEYKVQTSAGGAVGTSISLTPRNDQDKTIIEGLKTGSLISIKGIIKEASMRHLVIKPAILFQPAEAKPATVATPAAPEWPTVNVAGLLGKPASYITTDKIEAGRFAKLTAGDAEMDDYVQTTILSDEDASPIQESGNYLVIISKGIIRRDTGPMDGAYAINKTTGQPTAILLKDSRFKILGATTDTLPAPLKEWAKGMGADL